MSTVRQFTCVPPSDVLGAQVVHCTNCGKRLAPHDSFPVRETDGAWSCIVCPSSIAPRTFTAPMLDPSRPGFVRDVTIEIYAHTLLVRVAPARVGGEDAPHHRAADFTEQRAAIAAAVAVLTPEEGRAAWDAMYGPNGTRVVSTGALRVTPVELATEIASAASVGVDTGFAAGVKVERHRVMKILEALLSEPATTEIALAAGLVVAMAAIRSGATS